MRSIAFIPRREHTGGALKGRAERPTGWRSQPTNLRSVPYPAPNAGTTSNPSSRAASLSRWSRQTNSRPEGLFSTQMRAAASCRASPARSGCTRSKRMAKSLTLAFAATQSHPRARTRARARVFSCSPVGARSSRRRRAKADAISTGVAHHTVIDGSSRKMALSLSDDGSCVQSGTIADESQNFTGRAPVPREAL